MITLPEAHTEIHPEVQRGAIWLTALTAPAARLAGTSAAVRVVDAALAGAPARYIAVVPDARNRFERVRHGEIGLIEGWEIARAVRQIIDTDRDAVQKRPIVAVVDVTSQAYGRREEAYGIHQALAGAVAAYADARLARHPVIGVLVGKAISGAFLAHGYQANRLIAIDDAAVMVHAMGKAAAARITQRSIDALEALAATVPPMAYDIKSYASLGLLWRCLKLAQPDRPDTADVTLVRASLEDALADIHADAARDLSSRFGGQHREASRRVRALLREQWSVADA